MMVLRVLLSLVIAILSTQPLWAATYYVSTTGSDSTGTGSAGNPFRSIDKGIRTLSGATCDTLEVANGTYASTDGAGTTTPEIVAYIRSGTNAAGSAGCVLTVRSTNLGGAIITIPSVSSKANAAFYVNQPYWVIERFTITGGTNNSLSTSHNAIFISNNGGHVIARFNTIHDVARTVCSNSDNGNTGIFVIGAAGASLHDNTLYAIGRLRNGESGCVTTHYQHDHGFYVDGVTGSAIVGLDIYRNLCYDTNRGYCLQVYGGSGASVTNLNVYNNTLDGHAPNGAGGSTPGLPTGQVILAETVTGNFKNNIYSNPSPGGAINQLSLIPTLTFDYELSDNADADMWVASPPAGVTVGAHLVTNTSPGFVGGTDYSLSPGSAAINTGTNVGLGGCVGVCDRGYVEYGTTDVTAPATPTGLTVSP